MLKSVLDDPAQQSDALDRLFDFDRPKGSWRIQRPDGQYWKATAFDRAREWTPDRDQACAFPSETAARHLIDINHGSDAGRRSFRGAKPFNTTPLLDGDFIVCTACGGHHEQDYCPTQAGEGMAL